MPTIESLGFTPFVHATIGEEITTWDYGHYNAYPLLVDPTLPNGGSTDWAVAEPAGKDFKSLGAFIPEPAGSAGPGRNRAEQRRPDTVVQINHIDSNFDPLQIDTSLVPPQSFISPADLLRYRLDPNSGNLFAHFKALELWNGSGRGKQAEFLDLRLGIWFNHLNQGLSTTGIADTDTHEFLPLNSAGRADVDGLADRRSQPRSIPPTWPAPSSPAARSAARASTCRRACAPATIPAPSPTSARTGSVHGAQRERHRAARRRRAGAALGAVRPHRDLCQRRHRRRPRARRRADALRCRAHAGAQGRRRRAARARGGRRAGRRRRAVGVALHRSLPAHQRTPGSSWS